MADKNQQELAVEAGKILITERLLFDPIVMEGTDASSPIGKWRENEPIKWNQELAMWEYETDANVFTCSRLNPDTDARGN